MKPKETTVGTVLRSLRDERGWTVYRMAMETGLNASQISRVEKGERTLTLDSARALCAALGVSLAVFDAAGLRGKADE